MSEPRLPLTELRRRIGLLPGGLLHELTRPGLNPVVMLERAEQQLEQRRSVSTRGRSWNQA